MGTDTFTYAYNGKGNRLQQTVNDVSQDYTLDYAAGLTQVLKDGTNSYLYGLGRIGEQQPEEWLYYLSDAIGSVRQLSDSVGNLQLEKGYKPYGQVQRVSGEDLSSYGFSGEWIDSHGLVYLRARYYMPGVGRFLSKDPWSGDVYRPMSYNRWLYVYANPVNQTDPSGMCLDEDLDGQCDYFGPPRTPKPKQRALCTILRSSSIKDCSVTACRVKVDESRDWKYLDQYNLSAYYTPHEDQPMFKGGSKVPIGALEHRGLYLQQGGDYVQVGEDIELAQKANEKFLYDNASVCTQGTGILSNGRIISCTETYPWWEGVLSEDQRDRVGFEWSRNQTIPYTPFKTVAKWSGNLSLAMGSSIYIPDLINFLEHWDPNFTNGILKIEDVGGGLIDYTKGIEAFDLYVGEGKDGYRAYIDLLNCSSSYPGSDWYDRHEDICEARPVFGQLVDVYIRTAAAP